MHMQGGAGFYTSDMTNKERMFEVRPEKILLLECLGPPESDWNLQSFQVSGEERGVAVLVCLYLYYFILICAVWDLFVVLLLEFFSFTTFCALTVAADYPLPPALIITHTLTQLTR